MPLICFINFSIIKKEEFMADSNPILKMKDSPAVIAHVEMMQGIINRLSDISARCKEWCFASIGALLVLILSDDFAHNTKYIIIPYIIVVLFYILDSYYLGLERQMREHYKNFINAINGIGSHASREGNAQNTNDDIINSIFFPHLKYDNPSNSDRFKRQFKSTVKAIESLSTLLPYGFLLILVFICHVFLI